MCFGASCFMTTNTIDTTTASGTSQFVLLHALSTEYSNSKRQRYHCGTTSGTSYLVRLYYSCRYNDATDDNCQQ